MASFVTEDRIFEDGCWVTVGFHLAQWVKYLPVVQKTQRQNFVPGFGEDPLEEA